jgi:uncharacterized protein YeaO (DUF488 family)
MSSTHHSKPMNDEHKLVRYTASWTNLWRASEAGVLVVQPVRLSLGKPKFWPHAVRIPYVEDLAPSGWVRSLDDRQKFRQAYRQKLERVGIESIVDQLAAIQTDEPLALACFEQSPTDCHRGLLAEWFELRLGVRPPELTFNVDSAEQLTLDGSVAR